MKLPMSWLKDYVSINIDINNFIEKMTMSGTKVENVEFKCKNIKNIVTGKIISIEKHKDADRLLVTKVDIGKEEKIQIVTAAKNIFEEAIVPVALNGAVLANGVVIKNSKLRGILSQGMFCSIEELGYTKDDYPEASEDGIYIFKENLQLGIDVCPILELKEDIVEFEITSNRVDCFSILGISREVAATFNKKFNYNYKDNNIKNIKTNSIDKLNAITIKNEKLCNRYILKVIKDIKICSSPQWLRHRLTSCGIKPINNIVDITNYVMLELGQPIHAYDIDSLKHNEIIVRNANKNEEVVTLDDKKITLDDSILVISNNNEIISIGGIIGCKNSIVKNTTKTILLESANFIGSNIRLSSKKLGLRTEASAKFEKNLDPNLAIEAINRCILLIEELNYGKSLENIVDIYPNKINPWEIQYSPKNINNLLGINIKNEEIENILSKICIKAKNNIAYIPTFRSDLKIEADIAEEVGRLYGYDNILLDYNFSNKNIGRKTNYQKVEDIIKNTMVSLGLYEIMTYSFESPKSFEKLNIEKQSKYRNFIKINNPLGEDYSIMKTNTLNSILNVISLNYNKRNEDINLFELSKIYLPEELPLKKLPEEKLVLTIGLCSYKNKEIDFYYIKGIVRKLFETLGIHNEEYEETKDYTFMHKEREAKIFIKNNIVGFLGEIDINVQNNYNIGKKVYIAIIEIDNIHKYINLNKIYQDLPKFPSVFRDISIVIKDKIKVKEIENIIKNKEKKLIESIKLFDIYKGYPIKDGFKSVSYHITFRSKDRTLTDKEVDNIINKIVKEIEIKLEGKLRI